MKIDHLQTLLPQMIEVKGRVLDLHTQPNLPDSYIAKAEPFFQRAEARLRLNVSSLKGQEKESHFYSYFSEIPGEGYELSLRKQYESYLKFLGNIDQNLFLDVGCGAGEFLSFLKERGIKAKGIDLDESEVKRGRSRGLDVEQAEATEFLRSTDKRFSGISLIEVIEHMRTEDIRPFIESAVSKLCSNGVLLIETINMRHPLAVSGFYTDPTHNRPISDDFVSFLFQWYGLVDVQVIYTNPVWVSGVSHGDKTRIYYNYAVLGRKA